LKGEYLGVFALADHIAINIFGYLDTKERF
jgi:hypothetical protein